MAYDLRTKNGHNFYDISSMLQKSIRRGNLDKAGYAANELYGNYANYLWKRLFVISAEDCGGIITKEIVALKQADDMVNKGKKGYDKDTIFISKAILLLCLAKKNRDACYVACNFISLDRTLRPDEIEHVDISEFELGPDGIPEWTYDNHTIKGKMNGKTDLDMTIDEQNALEPLQLGLFDNASWGNYYDQEIKSGRIRNPIEIARIRKFQEGKENDPSRSYFGIED